MTERVRFRTPSMIGIGGVIVAAIVVVAGLWAGQFEIGLLVAAATLGVTHAIEPDHVAGITALTHEAGDPRLSALVGGCFATGHVVLVVVWIGLATAIFGTTEFPAVYEQAGLVLVGVILTALGVYSGRAGRARSSIATITTTTASATPTRTSTCRSGWPVCCPIESAITITTGTGTDQIPLVTPNLTIPNLATPNLATPNVLLTPTITARWAI